MTTFITCMLYLPFLIIFLPFLKDYFFNYINIYFKIIKLHFIFNHLCCGSLTGLLIFFNTCITIK